MEFQDIKDIAIYGTNCVVDISRGADELCRFISAKEKYYDVYADNGQLTVTQKSKNIFYRIIMRKVECKLVLPKSFNGKIRFRNKNGGLYIKDCRCTEVDLSTKNGKFEIADLSCGGFTLKMKNGGIDGKNIQTADAFIKCSNGHIKLESVSASSLGIACKNIGLTAVGVKSDKFDCSTRNGTIDVSALDAADIKLETDNGKINALALGSRDDYRLNLETDNGSVTVDGTPSKTITDAASDKKHITAKTSNGDIDIRFV